MVQTLTPWLAIPPPDPELAETPPGGVKARTPPLLLGLGVCEPLLAALFTAPRAGSLQNGLERIGSGPRQVRFFPVRDWVSPRIDDAFSHECTENVMLQERDILGAHGKPALLACGWHSWSVQAHTAVLWIWTSLGFWVLEWIWNFCVLHWLSCLAMGGGASIASGIIAARQ